MVTIVDDDRAQDGDGEGRHNEPDCEGTFIAMHNSVDEMAEGGCSARICSECGAWRPVEDIGHERDDDPEAN